MAVKASPAGAAAAPHSRRAVARLAARLLQGTANPDGPGLLLRGQEFSPVSRAMLARAVHGDSSEGDHWTSQPAAHRSIADQRAADSVRGGLAASRDSVGKSERELEMLVLESLLRLGRVAVSAADLLREHPDAHVRRSAAVLAARAYPLRAAFDE